MNDNDFDTRPSITDENLIAAAMKYLQYHDPENATREDAISLLAFMQTVAKEVSTTMSEDGFDTYYEAYKAQRPEA
ncbi:MAG: hypothetical protein WBP22_02660 [Candidatus Saccharimonas sp.]